MVKFDDFDDLHICGATANISTETEIYQLHENEIYQLKWVNMRKIGK